MELKMKKTRLVVSVMVMFLLSTIFASAEELKGTVIAPEGFVRSTASFSSEVVDILKAGSNVLVQEHKDRWYYIKAQDSEVEGWIFEDLMVVEKSVKTQKGVTTASVLNVRQEPNTNGRIITRLSQGSEVYIVTMKDEWFQIKSQQSDTAWIHSDFVKIVPNYPAAVILVSDSALREGKSTDEKSILKLNKDEKIYIKGYEEGWYLVVTENFLEGWVSEEDIELEINITRPVSRSGEREGIFANVSEITNKYLGKKYGWGQTGPDRFDCSGFTTYIINTYYGEYLKSKGISLPRTSRDQATVGTNVSRAELRPGDLVFFNTEARMGRNITHVGIYLGSGQFIHASSARSVVMISSISEGYYNTRYIKAIRL